MQTKTVPQTFDTFVTAYDEAVKRKQKQFTANGHSEVKEAFQQSDRVFTSDNWNDPLMDILRGDLYEKLMNDSRTSPIQGHLIHEDDQHSMVLIGFSKSLVLTWYKNRGQTEACFRISNPERPMSLHGVYTFFEDAGYDAESKLKALYR